MLLVLAILVIYLVLGILYESFIHPLTILSGLPSAGFGALAHAADLRPRSQHLRLRRHHHADRHREEERDHDDRLRARGASGDGKHARAEAIIEAASVRFRPIMMTTMAALVGTLPIALGFGAGAESRRPLGLAVVGGLLFSQLITLYITPVFYTYLDAWQQRLAQRGASRKAPFLERATGRGQAGRSHRMSPRPTLAAGASASELPALLRRPAGLADRHLDAVGGRVLAGLPAHRLGGAARAGRLRQPDSGLPVSHRSAAPWPTATTATAIVIATQIASMVLAARPGRAHPHSAWCRSGTSVVLAALLGVVNAFDIPARQSFVVEMVGREDLHERDRAQLVDVQRRPRSSARRSPACWWRRSARAGASSPTRSATSR